MRGDRTFTWIKRLIGMLVAVVLTPWGAAASPARDVIQNAIHTHHVNAEIRIERVDPEGAVAQPQSAEVVYDGGGGLATVRVFGETGPRDVRVRYSALKRLPVATRKIGPMEPLNEADFRYESVDVSKGMYPSLRGLLVEHVVDLRGFESRQTILPGQPALTSGIQRVAEVRRGDVLQLRIVSQGLSIQTSAQAEEPGYGGQTIRVLIQKTKKPMQARVVDPKTVEVQL